MFNTVASIVFIILCSTVAYLIHRIRVLEEHLLATQHQITDILDLLKRKDKLCTLRHNAVVSELNFPNSEE